jgi:ubiquitin-protein ligase
MVARATCSAHIAQTARDHGPAGRASEASPPGCSANVTHDGGTFKLTNEFPAEFLRKAPAFKKTTKIWRPLCTEKGGFCDEILNKSGTISSLHFEIFVDLFSVHVVKNGKL